MSSSKKNNDSKSSSKKRSNAVVVTKTKVSPKSTLFPEKLKKVNKLLEKARLLEG